MNEQVYMFQKGAGATSTFIQCGMEGFYILYSHTTEGIAESQGPGCARPTG